MQAPKTFQMKGSLFTLSVLKLQSIDFPELEKELTKTVEQAPKFFHNAPIVIDLQPLANLGVEIDFSKLSAILGKIQLIPIGVRNGSPEQHEAAARAHLAILPNIKSTTADQPETTSTQNTKTAPTPSHTTTRIITQPVRSGSQVYAEGGDLLILSSVSHGAEVLADGNIHIYGPLRGRALAGVRGDKNARIFCTGLEAELISIAGHYKVSEEFAKDYEPSDRMTHIYLDNDKIAITEV